VDILVLVFLVGLITEAKNDDGGTMNLREAIILAIQNEIKSQNIYQKLANAAKSEHARTTFLNLIPLEKIHEEKLINIFKKEFDSDPEGLDYSAILKFNGAAPENPEEILKFAIEMEDHASEMYLKLAAESDNEFMKITFTQLAKEEENHHELLALEIEQMQGIAIWFDQSELSGLFED